MVCHNCFFNHEIEFHATQFVCCDDLTVLCLKISDIDIITVESVA